MSIARGNNIFWSSSEAFYIYFISHDDLLTSRKNRFTGVQVLLSTSWLQYSSIYFHLCSQLCWIYTDKNYYLLYKRSSTVVVFKDETMYLYS